MPITNEYIPGNKIKVVAAFTDEAGTPADPDVVTLKVWAPGDLTFTAYVYLTDAEVLKDSVGNYHGLIDATTEGVWRYRWEGTGTIKAASEGAFTVIDSKFV